MTPDHQSGSGEKPPSQSENHRQQAAGEQADKKQLEIRHTIKRLLLAVDRWDRSAAEDRIDELEKLIPRDPRLAAWQETIEKLPRNKKEGPVELAPRTADDRPAAKVPVEISLARRTFPPEEPPQRRTTTDGQGVARFSWPVGVTAVRVAAPGVGYGCTGSFEVLGDSVARVSLPLLLPYGSIAGHVPKDVSKPVTAVSLSEMGDEKGRRATCDAQGRFAFADVPDGSYQLRLYSGSDALKVTAGVNVLPGQSVQDVKFQKWPVVEPGQSAAPPEARGGSPEDAEAAKSAASRKKEAPPGGWRGTA